MGADEEPGRRLAVEGERSRRNDSGPVRSIEAAGPDHADHGFVAAGRSGLRKDLAALLRASGRVRRRLCPRLVQTDAPRYGPEGTLPRPARPARGTDLARPGPGGRSPTDRERGHRRSKG